MIFVYLLHTFLLPIGRLYVTEQPALGGERPVLQHQRSRRGHTNSKMLKEARPVAEAAVISVAIVIAALAVPAAILYVAV